MMTKAANLAANTMTERKSAPGRHLRLAVPATAFGAAGQSRTATGHISPIDFEIKATSIGGAGGPTRTECRG